MRKHTVLVSVLALTAALLVPAAASADLAAEFQAMLDDANAALATSGSDLRVGKIEWLTADGTVDAAGNTVFFNNRGNKQLNNDWVPFDPRRTWSTGAGLTYLADQSDGATDDGLSNADTEAAIDRAMATWDVDTTCSNLPLDKVADPGVDPEIIDFLLGFGPPPGPGWPFADVVHTGWLPGGILGPNVLGVTFTLIFTSGGVPTDIDGNGLVDTAIKEIFYNDAFTWLIDGNIDVETVALHEAGHALSQAHFGAAFRTEANGKVHFSPRALMNAAYSGIQQDVLKTDLAGHCSLWSDWPNN